MMTKINCPFCLDSKTMSVYGNVTVDIIKVFCSICNNYRFFDRRDKKVYKTLEEIKNANT
jgi:transcription elongation factor Elf1